MGIVVSTVNSKDITLGVSNGGLPLTVGANDTLGGSITLEAGASGSANAGDATFVAGDSRSSDGCNLIDGGNLTIETETGPIRGGDEAEVEAAVNYARAEFKYT